MKDLILIDRKKYIKINNLLTININLTIYIKYRKNKSLIWIYKHLRIIITKMNIQHKEIMKNFKNMNNDCKLNIIYKTIKFNVIFYIYILH